MPLVSQDLPTLIGGISEQPAEVRKTSQVSYAQNVSLDPAVGLAKRPGTEVVTSSPLPSEDPTAVISWIPFDGGDGHGYAIRLSYSPTNSSIHAVALDGLNAGAWTRIDTNGISSEYLRHATRVTHATVGSSIFLANDQVEVKQAINPTPAPPNEYILHIKNPPVSIDRKSFVPLSLVSHDENGKKLSRIRFTGYAPSGGSGDGDGIGDEAPETAGIKYGNSFQNMVNWGATNVSVTGNGLSPLWGLTQYACVDERADYVSLRNAYNAKCQIVGDGSLQGFRILLNNPAEPDYFYYALPGVLDTIADDAVNADLTWNTWQWEMLGQTQAADYLHNVYYAEGGTVFRGTRDPLSAFIQTFNLDETSWHIDEGEDLNAILFSREAGPTIENLPYQCFDGFQTRITTDPESEAEYYYLQYVKSDAAWLERAKEGEDVAWDASTLPHILRYDYSNGFTFGPYEWEDRKAGDAESHRAPAFLGGKINDIGFYQDRLMMASGYSVVFSETQEPGNFWRQSMTTLLDNDRLDLEMNATESGSGIITSLTVTPDGVLVGSDRAQYLITSGSDPFTGKNVRVEVLGAQSMSGITRPVLSGDSTYFATEHGGASQLWEYNIVNGTSAVPVNVSGHCPRLIQGHVTSLVADTANDQIICISDGGDVFDFRHLKQGDQRLQAAWSKNTGDDYGTALVGAFSVADRVYFANTHSIFKRLANDHRDPCGWSSRLDARQPCSAYNVYALPAPGSGYRIKPPSQANQAGNWRIVDLETGAIVPVTNTADGIPVLPGDNFILTDPTAGNLVWGAVFDMDVEFSELVMRNPSDQNRPLLGGRTQLRTLTLRHQESGPFDVICDIGGEQYATSHTFTNQQTPEAFGPPQPSTGSFITDVGGNAPETTIRVTSANPYPVVFTSARYEVLYHRRGR